MIQKARSRHIVAKHTFEQLGPAAGMGHAVGISNVKSPRLKKPALALSPRSFVEPPAYRCSVLHDLSTDECMPIRPLLWERAR
jgi:hypothetical protein